MAEVSGAELVALFEKVRKAAERAVQDGEVLAAEEARCQDALKAMGAVEVSTALLMSTQVGKQLRKLTKHKSSSISSSAQELLEAWKKVVAEEALAKTGTPNGTPKDVVLPSTTIKPETKVVKTEVKTEMRVYTSKNSKVETKVVSQASPKVESKSVPKKVAPPPKKVSPSLTKVESTKSVSSLPPQAAGKSSAAPSSSSAPSSSANSSAANGFEPKIGALPKAGGDATRDKFRELLLEAFKKCCNEVSGEDLEKARKTDFVRVTVAVETALFSSLGLSKGSEKARYRSIIFNLKDDKNPDFRRRVLLGEIKPEEIVGMTADDMASDARKKENETIREKALFECERGLQNVASTDQFKCGKCHQRKTTYFQLQTRSADEPMTTFVQCVNCNNRWKFC